jgi:hypothetical protein
MEFCVKAFEINIFVRACHFIHEEMGINEKEEFQVSRQEKG